MLSFGCYLLILVLPFNCFGPFQSTAAVLPQDEVEALREIGGALVKTDWDFSVDPCSGGSSWVQPGTNKENNNTVSCNCTTVCHIVGIGLKRQNLSGVLPPALARLPYLKDIDLTRNYLNGTIPTQWATMRSLQTISVLGNRLSGPIPKEFGNLTALTSLVLDANQFSGGLPPELGNLANLERFIVPSNQFTGELPETLAKLTNLKDFRISDNRFTGKIPDFIQNWTQLERLDLQSCGLEGPIPSGISRLERMITLLISDLNGPESAFPDLSKMLKMRILVLRNCNLTGEIPPYIGGMIELTTLDLSFNKLEGNIPSTFKSLETMEFMYLTSNLLTGPVPQWMLNKGANIDLSYNNFTWERPGSSECPPTDINLFGSSSAGNNTNGAFPCSKDNFHCSKHFHSLHINCGGDRIVINGNTTYEEDKETSGASKFALSSGRNWALSSTGSFINDKYFDDYIAENKSKLSMPNSELYTRARLSPITLTYYGLCLLKGNYTVKLHFAEIIFTDDKTFNNLGRRIFDVYIQGKLVLKDFNINDEAGGFGRAVVKNFTVAVNTNSLEIRFYWHGKGTKSIPDRGTYGPLISAISVDPDFPPPKDGKAISIGAVFGIVAAALSFVFLVLVILWKKGCLGGKSSTDQGRKKSTILDLNLKRKNRSGLDLQTGSFTLRQIKAATDNFDISNKIGEGGFGSVYKGLLPDGTIIAVKQLSSKSSQGNREFLNEIGMISALHHPNLVKLYGCCIEGDQLLLVYEYMENNSLARALFRLEECQLQLDWPTRYKICVGIARGLAFLHEESRLKVVHRDVKATNVLLDKDLNPKISDFGLAKLNEGEKSHISTQIAGTIGYMAPEYAVHGYLTDKADVYSFGIVALEIVRGKRITSFVPEGDCIHLVDWVYILQERGTLLELVDPSLGLEFNEKEVISMLNVALLCTNASPTLRPTMSAVISMLEGHTAIQVPTQNPSSSIDDSKFITIGKRYHQSPNQSSSSSPSQTLITPMDQAGTGSSASAHDLYQINVDSQYWDEREVHFLPTVADVMDDLLNSRGLELQPGHISLKQIKAATNNFDPANKIGEGGFGPVYKGTLSDGSKVAVKQLSSRSKQGNREFLNEIGMISALQHPNLVKLFGCCVEGNQLLVIYEYMENNSLARALIEACVGREEHRLKLDSPTRHKICFGIARGLAHLHEESRLKIVHRDIKATNVLLDKDLNTKISDFGLAKLDEEENTHISTRIAGTIGYIAPEYAMRGYLTDKADVYSFRVVLLEIVSGTSNTNCMPKEDFVHLLDWAYVLQEQGSLLDLVDPSLGLDYSEEEALRMLNLALLCTNPSPSLRPAMSAVVSMLEGKIEVPAALVKRSSRSENLSRIPYLNSRTSVSIIQLRYLSLFPSPGYAYLEKNIYSVTVSASPGFVPALKYFDFFHIFVFYHFIEFLWQRKKMLLFGCYLLVLVLPFNCFGPFQSTAAVLSQDEVEAIREIGRALVKTDWDFSVDPCSGGSSWVQPGTTKENNNTVSCNCTTVCHIVGIGLKRQNLRGVLPPALARLPYLKDIDLTRNYLNGTIPTQWATMRSLQTISVLGNRLSGPIPKEFGNLATLTSLVLDANQFSGSLPPELGNLTNLERFMVPSNQFTGELPKTLAKLTNLEDFRISDNHFNGKIPDFIQNWTQLKRLYLQSCGLEGPIPFGISRLERMIALLISDLNGPESAFPDLSKMLKMQKLVLRNCNLAGEIPAYIGGMMELTVLDLSFNKLEGNIPSTFKSIETMQFMYLTSNLLTGPVPQWMLNKRANIDLSYNNFTWERPGSSECPPTEINLFGSSSAGNNTNSSFPCSKDNFHCSKHFYSLHINCGGDRVVINRNTTYEEDKETSGASKLTLSSGRNWALSSTGNFISEYIDDYIAENKSKLSMPNSELYIRARLSPITLTYYGLCLLKGNYTVKLHFAEIIFTDDKTYNNLGRRIFDVYIQGKLVLKDFNIKDEAGGFGCAVVKNFTASVNRNSLEIRFYWHGKGTTSIPNRGTYGPLISAISVDPDFPPPKDGKAISIGAVIGIVVAALSFIFLVLGILWKKGCLGGKTSTDQDLTGLDLQTGSFTLRQIKAATDNFDISNKIGEGGFGSVYKGLLPDGTIIAVKQLSSKSSQGNREFLNEIGMISALHHPNLVKLYGCCIEGDQLLLVYEYMENNSLARALFRLEECQLQLDWPTRYKICVGIARGLAFLHEESRLKVVHRDVKATNVLLDKDMNPKISDFGLAKLDEGEKSHISTRIAGTIGYMAPEYAVHGYLTDKADVYSFGIVALEIVRGKRITSFMPEGGCIHLVDWVYILQERGSLLELVDPSLGSEFNEKEVISMLNVALLCTNASPTLRPTMSAVISMLEGRTAIQVPTQNPSSSVDDSKFITISKRYHQSPNQSSSSSPSQTLITPMDQAGTGSFASAHDLYQTNVDSQYWDERE
ncbi:uncharacterized protein LOC131246947 [Magnolia sinica]|uniref:uncharacterized protein LOC131246947 n=1 Tax=Magnolia sinica TaxID=86752 RepID=UPI002658BED5|nr:uncharacterized protein LOC131246947 [Magnolia sinica]